MSSIQSKSSKHAQKWENTIHAEERNDSIKTGSQMTLVIELVEKSVNTAIENILHVLKEAGESTECYGETWKILK